MSIPRKRHWLTAAAVGTVLVFVALLLACTAILRHVATTQLSSLDAGEVRIRSASVGLLCHTLHDISLAQSDLGEDPWLTVEKTVVDLPLWHVLMGRVTPRVILAQGVQMRVGADDQIELSDILRAAFARRLPCRTLYVEMDRLTVHEQPFGMHSIILQARNVADRVYASARPRGADAAIDGKPSAWAAHGRLDYAKRRGTLAARGLGLPVSIDRINDFSLGPVSLAQVQGRAQCDFDASVQFSESEILNSMLNVSARRVTLELPGGTARVAGGRGKAAFENGRLHIVGERLRIANGTVDLDSRIDFRKKNWTGTAVLQAADLRLDDLDDFVDGAAYPVRVQGKISLDAKVNLHGLADGVRLDATGQGRVANAGILNVPAEPLEVELLVTRCELRRGAPPLYQGHVQIDGAFPSIGAAQLFSLPPLKPYEPTRLPSGRLSAEASLTLPLDSIMDPETYRLSGRLDGHDVQWHNIHIPRAVAGLTFEEGKLQVEQVQLRTARRGIVTARAKVGLIPRGEIHVEGRMQEVPLSEIARHLEDPAVLPSGHLSARWNASVGVDEWRQIDRWKAAGTLAVSPVTLEGGVVTETTASIHLSRGSLKISNARMRLDNAQIEGNGAVLLREPYGFQAEAEGRSIPMAPLLSAANIEIKSPVQGTVNGTTRVEGTVQPWHYVCDGTAFDSPVTVADRDVHVSSLRWSLTPARLAISDAVLKAAGGQIVASGRIPFSDRHEILLEGSFDALNLARLTKETGLPYTVPQTSVAGDLTFRGRTWQELQGRITFAAPVVKTPYAKMRSVRGRLHYNQATVQLHAEADTLGGAADLRAEGQMDTSAMIVKDVQGTLTWQDIALHEATHDAMSRRPIPPLRATSNGKVTFTLPPGDRMPRLTGEVTFNDVAYGDAPVARRLAAQVILDKQSLQLQQIEGQVGNGSFRGDVQLPLDNPMNASFEARFNRVALRALQPWLAPDLAGVRGSINAQLRGRGGDVWRGTGTAHLNQARAAGVSANQVRAVFRWSASPESGAMTARGTIRALQLARGTLEGDWQAAWSRRLALEADLHVRKIDMQPLSRWIPRLNQTLRGRLDGHLALQSRNAESLDDWNGRFDVKLRESNMFVMPVIRAMAATLGVAAPRALSVSRIVARGRLQRGNLTLEQMTMRDPDVQVWIDGTLSRFGTLDLNVTADAPGAYAVGVVTGLLRPTDLLQRRLLFLHVGGNLRRPVVRPRTEEFLRQELVRFFLPVVTP